MRIFLPNVITAEEAKILRETNIKKGEAREIVEEAMNIAQSICVYTNSNLTIEEL